MTKYFKLLGVALIAMSMALVSCDPTEENPTDDQQQEQPGTGDNGGGNEGGGNEGGGNDPEPPTPGAGSIAVTFGGQSWDAETAIGMCSPMDGDVLAIALSEKDSMYVWPRADVYVWTNGATAPTTFQDNFIITETGQFGYENSNFAYVHYYDDGAVVDQNNRLYGDWWAKTATVNMTALDLTALTVSMTANAVMFEALPVLQGQVALESASTETMTVQVTGLVMGNWDTAKGAQIKRAVR